MKKIMYFLILICFVNVTNAQNPKTIFKSHLHKIDKFLSLKVGQSMSSDEFYPSIEFLENLTGIESDFTTGIELMDEPTKQNLTDWRNWFKKNRKLLYWNDNEKKVMVRK